MGSKKMKSLISVVLTVILAMGLFGGNVMAKEDQYKYLGVRGTTATLLDILQLQNSGNIMFIGAHPDDENNALLTYLNKGLHLKTSYLVGNWGEGGQNEIGDELYAGLGVIRSQELASARVIDGAKQLFFGASDFGYSVSTEETFSIWDREVLLGNIVRHIRTERPDVIFSHHRTGKGDHGQHMATGVMLEEAFTAAADPNRFPEQITEEGLQPWQVKKLYQAISSRDIEKGMTYDLELNLGEYSPILGMSYSELGALSRSMHRCQGMVRTPKKGESISRWMLSQTVVGQKNSGVMDGIDISLDKISDLLQDDDQYSTMKAEFDKLNIIIDTIINKYDPKNEAVIYEDLTTGIELVRSLKENAQASSVESVQKDYAIQYLEQKEEDFETVMKDVFAIAVDISLSDETVIPGQSFSATATVYNRGLGVLEDVNIHANLPEGWVIDDNTKAIGQLKAGQSGLIEFNITAGATAFTDAYDLSPLDIAASYSYNSQTMKVDSFNELKLVPALSVAVTPERAMLIASEEVQRNTLNVLVRNNYEGYVSGHVEFDLPTGWQLVSTDTNFEIDREDQETSVTIVIEVPADVSGDFNLTATVVANEQKFQQGYEIIEYPHIYTKHLYKPANYQLTIVDVKVADGIKVGYVDSGYDKVYESLEQMGVNVTLLTADDLATADLSVYDTIMLGVRAYKARPDLVTSNGRLLDYVEKGGNLVVQFNKTFEWQPEFAPYPIELSSTNINDENAEVTLLAPDHAVFNAPNQITDQDWDNWFQQRAEWTAESWDKENYTELMSAADPGQEDVPRDGTWLVAEYGEGTYMYTSIVWHLELDNLVPGAYRMIANILSLSEQ
ncbi:PIG-L family deacetylase [Vallitalea okinawensis]|uniref:PIG-L family deacetylase n=1 Tax=Vallitalea okinawensis TaxID=2078660 RepID=UPI000CFBE58F|nr:PIG-L family deacetylase [Vallitalea okinawensis]